MRYHQEKPDFYLQTYGETYICDHPAYNRCTLFKDRDIGLAVIQQRYDRKTKKTWWAEGEPWLVDRLYLHPGFYEYFKGTLGEKRTFGFTFSYTGKEGELLNRTMMVRDGACIYYLTSQIRADQESGSKPMMDQIWHSLSMG